MIRCPQGLPLKISTSKSLADSYLPNYVSQACIRRLDLLNGIAEHTKAQAPAPVVGRITTPARSTAAVHGIRAATPVDPLRTQRWPHGVRDRCIRIATIPIHAPTPYLPMHVVEPPRIRFLLTDIMRCSFTVVAAPFTARSGSAGSGQQASLSSRCRSCFTQPSCEAASGPWSAGTCCEPWKTPLRCGVCTQVTWVVRSKPLRS